MRSFSLWSGGSRGVGHQSRTLALSEEKRILLGLLVQPFLAAALTFASYPLLDRSGRAIYGGIDPDPLRSALGLAIYVSTAAFFVTVLAAFPAAVWVLKRHELTFVGALLWGLFLGNIPSVLGTVVTGLGYGLSGITMRSTLQLIRLLVGGTPMKEPR